MFLGVNLCQTPPPKPLRRSRPSQYTQDHATGEPLGSLEQGLPEGLRLGGGWSASGGT